MSKKKQHKPYTFWGNPAIETRLVCNCCNKEFRSNDARWLHENLGKRVHSLGLGESPDALARME